MPPDRDGDVRGWCTRPSSGWRGGSRRRGDARNIGEARAAFQAQPAPPAGPPPRAAAKRPRTETASTTPPCDRTGTVSAMARTTARSWRMRRSRTRCAAGSRPDGSTIGVAMVRSKAEGAPSGARDEPAGSRRRAGRAAEQADGSRAEAWHRGCARPRRAAPATFADDAELGSLIQVSRKAVEHGGVQRGQGAWCRGPGSRLGQWPRRRATGRWRRKARAPAASGKHGGVATPDRTATSPKARLHTKNQIASAAGK